MYVFFFEIYADTRIINTIQTIQVDTSIKLICYYLVYLYYWKFDLNLKLRNLTKTLA